MVRINLIPVEILEKRKYEKMYPWVFVIGAVLLAALLVTWALMQFLIIQANEELQSSRENVSRLQAQADALQVFELQEAQLQTRKTIAESTRVGAIDMSVLAEEISLVLPEEIWLDAITMDELEGVTLAGWTPDPVVDGYSPGSQTTSLREGYKSLAAMLVRLNALPTLLDNWLTSAKSEPYTGEGPAVGVQAVRFQSSSLISTASAVPSSTAAGQ